MNDARAITIDSPIGGLTLVAAGGELTGVFMEEHRRRPPLPGAVGAAGDPVLSVAAAQLREYLAGERTAFDLPLAEARTPFLARFREALIAVPYGETTTYGELATALGSPAAVRAVGMANARNPFSIVVPCHRVVGADGSLTGYAGGLTRKRRLLELEGALPAPLAA